MLQAEVVRHASSSLAVPAVGACEEGPRRAGFLLSQVLGLKGRVPLRGRCWIRDGDRGLARRQNVGGHQRSRNDFPPLSLACSAFQLPPEGLRMGVFMPLVSSQPQLLSSSLG